MHGIGHVYNIGPPSLIGIIACTVVGSMVLSNIIIPVIRIRMCVITPFLLGMYICLIW